MKVPESKTYTRDEVFIHGAKHILDAITVLERQNNYRLDCARWDAEKVMTEFIFVVENYFGVGGDAYYGVSVVELFREAELYATA